jgi:hypothetical protein
VAGLNRYTNTSEAPTVGAIDGMKNSVRYPLTPRLGRVSSIAVMMPKKIRSGTPKTMIQSVFLTDVQK